MPIRSSNNSASSSSSVSPFWPFTLTSDMFQLVSIVYYAGSSWLPLVKLAAEKSAVPLGDLLRPKNAVFSCAIEFEFTMRTCSRLLQLSVCGTPSTSYSVFASPSCTGCALGTGWTLLRSSSIRFCLCLIQSVSLSALK